jgi:hypothetical protein
LTDSTLLYEVEVEDEKADRRVTAPSAPVLHEVQEILEARADKIPVGRKKNICVVVPIAKLMIDNGFGIMPINFAVNGELPWDAHQRPFKR